MMEDSGPPPSKRAKTRWMTIMGEEGSRIVAEAIAEDILVKDNLISFTCKACNTSMSGVIPAETHLKGARHKKAVQNSRLGAASEPISSCDRPDSTTSSLCAVIKSGLVLCQSVGNQLQLTCVPCNKPCTGEVPMNQHLASDAHAKKMRQDILRPRCLPNKEAPTTPSSIPTTVQYDLASTEDVSSVQDVPTAIQCGLVLVMHMEGSTVVHFKCVPCNKQCTGEVPMKQHLTSEIHAKKLRQDALNPRCSPYKEAPITTTTTTPATTVQYDLVTPADVSPLQDLPTAIHRKLVSVMHVEGSNVVHFKCVPCNKQCTGEVPMKQHLTSEIHAKKLREEAMMQRFSPHKEVLGTTTTATTTQTNLALPADIPSVQVDEVAQAMEEDIIRQADYDASHLECLLCETFCTGRDAMKQHLQGKNHLKKQRLWECDNRTRCGFYSKNHDSKERRERTDNGERIKFNCPNCNEEHNVRSRKCPLQPDTYQPQSQCPREMMGGRMELPAPDTHPNSCPPLKNYTTTFPFLPHRRSKNSTPWVPVPVTSDPQVTDGPSPSPNPQSCLTTKVITKDLAWSTDTETNLDKREEEFVTIRQEVKELKANQERLLKENKDLHNILVSVQETVQQQMSFQASLQEQMICMQDMWAKVVSWNVPSSSFETGQQENEGPSDVLEDRISQVFGERSVRRRQEDRHPHPRSHTAGRQRKQTIQDYLPYQVTRGQTWSSEPTETNTSEVQTLESQGK